MYVLHVKKRNTHTRTHKRILDHIQTHKLLYKQRCTQIYTLTYLQTYTIFIFLEICILQKFSLFK